LKVGDLLGIPRVFIAYTARDLAAHADKIVASLRKLGMMAIDHRDSGATGQPSVEWCMEEVDKCDLVIVLLAHRYGWVPTSQEGGDGISSITLLEFQRAKASKKPILPYLVDESARWSPELIEALAEPSVLPKLKLFREELSRAIAGFFSDPDSLDGPVSRDAPRALARQASRASPSRVEPSDVRYLSSPQVRPWIYSRENPPSVADRMEPLLPKRVLCLDAGFGGMAVTLSYLQRFEHLLQIRYSDSEFRLSDYFDLIGGSGLGAILAAELALGKTVSQVQGFLFDVLTLVFKKRKLFFPFASSSKFSSEPVSELLKSHFQGATISAREFRTGVALVANDLAIGPCFITNHPSDLLNSPYAHIPLAEVLLGCLPVLGTLDPVFLSLSKHPRTALTSATECGATDPALHLLLMIKSAEYPFKWRLGASRLNIVSIGGVRTEELSRREVGESSFLQRLAGVFEAFQRSSFILSQSLLNSLATSDFTSEGTPENESRILAFKRYAVPLTDLSLNEVGLKPQLTHLDESILWGRVAVDLWGSLLQFGEAFARKEVTAESFLPTFDVREIVSNSGQT
jgi:uncharacterized protein